MNFISLDLELNQPSQKIIQVGAVVGDVYTGEVFEKLNCLIKVGEPISEYITKLTTITNEDVKNGTTLEDAYNQLKSWKEKYQTFTNIITWGGGDSILLKEQLGEVDWVFGRRWLDMKTIFQFQQISEKKKVQAGLAKALTKVGLEFEGKKHYAVDDAYNTFLLAHYFIKEGFKKL